MRPTGILRNWNDERGFGFIAPTQGGAELFVHISALPRDGSRPVVGETLSYELGHGKDGKPQAIKVIRLAVDADAKPFREGKRDRSSSGGMSWLVRGLLLILIVAVGSWGYKAYRVRVNRLPLESMPPTAPAAESLPLRDRGPHVATPTAHRCDGRTHCSQMKSCAEATWFINHCPGTKMDGNGDGAPCEQQWCTGPGAR